ncbi:hypothetical protein [Mesorhizobium sp.]|uniref:hypothetical protein n=1 Tax=Mesorhizobium sp. TaxID=1871066 RepID=UPI0025B878AF|nr:hypothetical protein [Mesorhizobium sp.]
MTATIANHGPDDEGTWIGGPAALGHHRLAIIDIQGGRQPRMLQGDGRPDLVLVYTGETYNYRELRQQLAGLVHRMNTSSDTEVVLPPRVGLFGGYTFFTKSVNVSRDIIPQSVVQRVKSPYPAIQNAAYDKILRTRFTVMLDDLVVELQQVVLDQGEATDRRF